jgi:hypothetical protein
MEKHITKLNQLDRIEFRIKKLDIEADYNFGVQGVFLLSILTVVFSLLFYFTAAVYGTMEVAKPIIYLYLSFGLGIVFIVFILVIAITTTRKKKLIKEYFEVKPKGDKK